MADAALLWLAKYLVLVLMFVAGAALVWLAAAGCRAVRWCWRRAHRWSRA